MSRLGTQKLIIDPISIHREKLLVNQTHPLLSSGRNRKNTRPKRGMPNKLEKRRVAGAGDQSLVGLTSLFGRDESSAPSSAGLMKGESTNHHPLRNRQLELGFLGHAGGILQIDLEGCGSQPPLDLDSYPNSGHMHRTPVRRSVPSSAQRVEQRHLTIPDNT